MKCFFNSVEKRLQEIFSASDYVDILLQGFVALRLKKYGLRFACIVTDLTEDIGINTGWMFIRPFLLAPMENANDANAR